MKKKGSFGYLKNKRILSLLKSVGLLAAVFIVFFAALHHFHTNRNIFSILAAVGALPAGRSVVVTVMCFRAKSASERVRTIVEKTGGLTEETSSYDLYLTGYEKSFSLSHAAVAEGSVIGLTEDPSTDCSLCAKHIRETLAGGGFGGYEVKIFSDTEKYADALGNLAGKAEAGALGSAGEKEPEDAENENGEEGGAKTPDTSERDARAMSLLRSVSL